MSDPIRQHGWTAVPRDASAVLSSRDKLRELTPRPVNAFEKTPLADAVTAYAKQELSEQTFNHSMRVYYYGTPTLFSPSYLIYTPTLPPTRSQ